MALLSSAALVLIVVLAASSCTSGHRDAGAGGSGGAGINLGAQACDPQATGCHQINRQAPSFGRRAPPPLSIVLTGSQTPWLRLEGLGVDHLLLASLVLAVAVFSLPQDLPSAAGLRAGPVIDRHGPVVQRIASNAHSLGSWASNLSVLPEKSPQQGERKRVSETWERGLIGQDWGRRWGEAAVKWEAV
ncbi:hypothetical protein MRS44_014743 [Fusarium solani]|uniref:uncharacterized protein n=1 Tax=Fusarium solani TaxID=169388 RepID=UPI0032C40809|nr:hypothetical protein MRS44_014743 [Fusarium solani]